MPRELSQFERYFVHEFVEDYINGLMSRSATQMPELDAAAPYYRPPPPLKDTPNI